MVSKQTQIKVLITTSTFGEAAIQILEKSGFEVINNPYSRKITLTEIVPLLENIQGVIAGLEQYDYDILSKSELKVISRCGSGLSNIDLDSAKKLGIAVFNTPEGPTQSVAELTVGCLLSLIRDVPRINILMHGGKWEKYNGRLLQSMKVLLIGYGRIGKVTAKILDAIGAKVLVWILLYHKMLFWRIIRKLISSRALKEPMLSLYTAVGKI